MKFITLATIFGLMLTGLNATAASSSDPCEIAAKRAVTKYESAAFKQANLKSDPEAKETFDGISEADVDDSDPSLYHVEYAFDDECLGGDVVRTHKSSDGLSCTADASSIEQDGTPDCG